MSLWKMFFCIALSLFGVFAAWSLIEILPNVFMLIGGQEMLLSKREITMAGVVGTGIFLALTALCPLVNFTTFLIGLWMKSQRDAIQPDSKVEKA